MNKYGYFVEYLILKFIIRWMIALEQSKTNYLLANPDQLLEGSVFADKIEEKNGEKPERGHFLLTIIYLLFI